MIRIRQYRNEDTARITEIYNFFVRHSAATFETSPLSEEQMRERISTLPERCRCIIAETPDGETAGYAYIHRWKSFSAYAPTMETTIYLDPRFTGQKIGSSLMQALIDMAREAGVHSLISCITADNTASIRLCEKFGFKKASYFKEVGWKFNRNYDVIDLQLIL